MIKTDGQRTISNGVPRADFSVRDEGTLVLLWLVSDEAVAWGDEFLPEDRTTWGEATVIERRYFPEILEGLLADGLRGRAV